MVAQLCEYIKNQWIVYLGGFYGMWIISQEKNVWERKEYRDKPF